MANVKKKSKSGSVVYAVFLILYIILLCAVVYFALGKVWSYAEEYENARPDPVIDGYVEKLNENLFDDTVAATIQSMPHPFQTDEEVAAVIQEMFGSELTYKRTVGGDGNTSINYAIFCEGNAFGRVTLVRDESKINDVQFGNLPWKVASEEFDFSDLYSSLELTVPESYSVAVNNRMLGEEFIINRGIRYDVLEAYYEDYPQLPTKVTYHVDHILGHLDPVIYDDKGNVTSIDPNQNDSQFIDPIDPTIRSRLEAFAVGFSDPYLAYSSNVSDPHSAYAAVENYLLPNGDLAARLKLTLDGYEWAHTTSYRFEGAQLVNAVALGDGYYVADIHAQTTITYPNKGENGVVHDNNGLRVLVYDMNGTEMRAVTVERYVPEG